MTNIEHIISQGEGLRIEFKEAADSVPYSFYETVVSFSNSDGGVILLGVDDNGVVKGIDKDSTAKLQKDIVTALNSKEFINRHLPDKFYMEGDRRIDLRDRIFREVIGNIIIHREYTDATATELIIEEDAVRTLNPNNPYFNGIMDLDKFNPHPKNPNIRKFFMALGWADEIGSGIRNTKYYLPFYTEKAKPVFIDEPFFRTIIPLTRYTMSNFAKEWFNWLELDDKWFSKLTQSLAEIEVNVQLYKKNWTEQISELAPSWIEKGTKLKELNVTVNKQFKAKEPLSFDEKVTKSDTEKRLSMNEKVTKSINTKNTFNQQNINYELLNVNEKVTKLPKKLQYIIVILILSGVPVTIDELIEIFSFSHKTFFRQNYLKPSELVGFIQKTNPEKPTASNQKYLITEKGKIFLADKNE